MHTWTDADQHPRDGFRNAHQPNKPGKASEQD